MKIAFLATDVRQHLKDYTNPVATFGTAPEALLAGFAKIPELEVHVLSCTQHRMKSQERLSENIRFHSLYVPKIGWLRTGYQGCIRAVRRKLRELRPDLVHGQGTERDCAITAALSGFPNVITIHGNMDELARLARARVGTYAWLVARLEDFTLKRTGGVFCNSRHTESVVRTRARRTWLVPNSLREGFFDAPPKRSPNSGCILLNVGAITANKRQMELLDVARDLHKQGLKFEWRFIGKIPPGESIGTEFLNRVREAEASGFARFEGEKSLAELIRNLDQASALIHFPRSEAFGLVVAEALSRNLKLFCSRVGGIVDITEGIAGVDLFETEDLAGLQAALAQWIRAGTPKQNPTAALMRERYHPEAVARRHLEIYREFLASDS